MNEPTHHRRIYFKLNGEGVWEEVILDSGSVLYHILFDMPAGEVYSTSDYEYKWETA